MSIKPFHAWALKDMHLLVHSVQTAVHYRGETIFEQDSPVKGIYILRHGTVQMQRIQYVQESELRFPGREDLIMEEEIEFKVKNVVRNVPLGICKETSTFGEELAGKLPLKVGAMQDKIVSANAFHAYSLVADSTVVLMIVPWQAYQERLEDKKSVMSLHTLDLLGENKSNRADYIDSRVRCYRASRFFVDLAKHKHLNPGAYLRALESVQRFMDLYTAIIGNKGPGQHLQHSDVQAAETAANKSIESFDCISRACRTPAQTKELKRLIGKMVFKSVSHSGEEHAQDSLREK